MPRPKHLVTPQFGFEYPELGAEGNVPADLHELALQIENIIKALEPKFLKTAGAGDAKKLLIVGATGAPAFAAMSGDATISEAGAITIANEAINAAKILALAVTEAKLAGESVSTAKIKLLAVTAATLAAEAVETAKIKNLAVTEGKLAELAVTTAKIAALAITEGKIADAAVTSRKFKPSAAQLQMSVETIELTEAYADVTGCKLEITPAVASKLLVWAFFEVRGTEAEAEFRGSIKLDAEAENALLARSSLMPLNLRQTIGQCWILNLSAAAHTIQLRAKKDTAKKCHLFKAGTQMSYMLMAE